MRLWEIWSVAACLACSTSSGGAQNGGPASDQDAGEMNGAGGVSTEPTPPQTPSGSDAATPDSPANDPATDAAPGDVNAATDGCGQADGQLFSPNMPWNTPITEAPLDAESDAIIGYLEANHDTGTRFQIDFSFRVLHATADTERRTFEPTEDFYEGECDPAPVPVPVNGGLEGEEGYACDSDGDCHLIVVDQASCRLYEMWRADIRETFRGGCLAVWDTDHEYGETLRGDGCTSADAAGLPITPLLFNADEVFSGEIRHALRFILPNQHIREQIYARPGTHSTSATSGPATAPPYAARLRLRADVDVSELSAGAKVVAKALQTYGMVLADGGNLTFTGQSDADTQHTWEEAQLTPQDLKGLSWSDFEVVELGERLDYRQIDCQREPVTE